jgi:hypothetical protein
MPLGNFQSLVNSVFQKEGLLQKRNGFGSLTDLGGDHSYLTTLNGNLIALGEDVSALNVGNDLWVSSGTDLAPMQVSVLPAIRNSLGQTQCDASVAANGLTCLVYSQYDGSSTTYYYVIIDSTTGQNIVEPTLIPANLSGTVTGSPRVFLLGNYWIVVFTNVVSATSHLQYIAISTVTPSSVTAPADIAPSYVSSTTLSWDGVVAPNNELFIAYNTTSGGQNIGVKTLSSTLILSSPLFLGSGATASLMTMCVDTTISNPVVYITFWSSGSGALTAAVYLNLTSALSPVLVVSSGPTLVNLASAAQGGVCTVFYEVQHAYSYDSGVPTNFVDAVTTTQGGSVGSPYTVVRGVGLASKAFLVDGTMYFLSAYESSAASGAGLQSSYFLVNGSTSTSSSPVVVGKLAYSNGGGYLTTGLPSVTVAEDTILIPYLFKDLIETQAPSGSSSLRLVPPAVYTQTGINVATITFDEGLVAVEAERTLQIGGGIGWLYDGSVLTEHGFLLWPDSIEVTTATSGGHLKNQQYYYQVIYEYTDNQGNVHRSAPSIPVTITTSGSNVSVNTIHGPNLRLTYKTPVRIRVYRWSVDNQVYYEVTSVTSPLLSSTSSDSWSFADSLADASIIGNPIIYTTGGVVEDIAPPPYNITTLFDTRQWVVDAEDQNLLWFSKQNIEAVPVEFSDLLTLFIAPNAGTSFSTGPITAMAPMDDKLVLFKKDAIFYINGTGPDNTGANSQYSQPIFVTSAVGCANPSSIILTPTGLMFQSDKGIWVLGRDLGTQYIGKDVENFNSSVVTSATSVPETNQVRFTLSTGEQLMYDYFFGQWGTFSGVPAESSCIYDGLHTIINSVGEVSQETPGTYYDRDSPVLMSFVTAWVQLSMLQGFQRFHHFMFVGRFLSPHMIDVGLSYNFNASMGRTTRIQPNNFSSAVPGGFGDQPAPYGSHGDLEQWKVSPQLQRCQSFQISVQEVFDPSQGTAAGAGFTMSGLNMKVLMKKGDRPIPAAQSAG